MERTLRISLDRSVQLVKFEDTIKYGVTISTTQEPDEPMEDFKARALREAQEAFSTVEEAYLHAAYETDRDGQANDVNPIAWSEDEPAPRRAPPPAT